jgi:hypothetical protein
MVERKQWAMNNLADILTKHAAECGLRWGWGNDPVQEYHRAVLYVDLPTGQVSFHAQAPGKGPAYHGEWDGVREQSATRIIQWIAQLFADRAAKAA